MKRFLIAVAVVGWSLLVSDVGARKTYTWQEIESMKKAGKLIGNERFVIIRGRDSSAIMGDKTEIPMLVPSSEMLQEKEAEPQKEIPPVQLTPPVEAAVKAPVEETVEEPVKEAVEEAMDLVLEETVEELVEEAVEETAEEAVEEAVEETVQEAIEETAEETVEETVEETEEEAVAEAVEEMPEEKPEPVRDIIATDKVGRTRYLITMAREHYGNGDFWVYIYEENKAKLGHPDHITPGTVVQIPNLAKYGVDPKNPADMQKARQLGKEIYGRYGKRI